MMSRKGLHEGLWKKRKSEESQKAKSLVILRNRGRGMMLKHSKQWREWRNQWSEKKQVKSSGSGKEFAFILMMRMI